MSTPAGLGAGQSLAGWQLLRELGRGASGTVYLAARPDRSELVALKAVPLVQGAGHPSGGDMFLAAARAAMRLKHPHIVQVLDAGLAPGLAWLTMEAVAGTDLVRYTRPPRLLPEAVVLRLGQRLALALAHAHGLGLVHRDLKPANVLVDWATDTVKLADFGLVRVGDTSNTGTGIVPGTPAYMAPEQLAGAAPGAATDLYALGVLLFELLAGRLPHEGRSMGELLQRVARDTPPPLASLRPDLRPGLADLVDRLLAKSAALRPTGMTAVADALQRLLGGLEDGGAKSH